MRLTRLRAFAVSAMARIFSTGGCRWCAAPDGLSGWPLLAGTPPHFRRGSAAQSAACWLANRTGLPARCAARACSRTSGSSPAGCAAESSRALSPTKRSPAERGGAQDELGPRALCSALAGVDSLCNSMAVPTRGVSTRAGLNAPSSCQSAAEAEATDKCCAQERCEVRGGLLDEQTQAVLRAPFSPIKVVYSSACGDDCSRKTTRGARLQCRSVPSATRRLVPRP